MATVWPRGAGCQAEGRRRHGFHPFDIRAEPVVSAPLVSAPLGAPDGASGPAKVATHVGLFVLSGSWDKRADSPISYLTKHSPNTSPKRRTGNNPRELEHQNHMAPSFPGKGKASVQPEKLNPCKKYVGKNPGS